MQSKRDYLVGLGLAKPGRGKFSNAGKQAIAEAEANGMRFSDSVPETPAVVKGSGKTTTSHVPAPTKPGQAPFLAYTCPSDFRYPEGEWQAYVTVDGKKKPVSLRECCNTCRVSLTNHGCDAPTIHDMLPVKIVPVRA